MEGKPLPAGRPGAAIAAGLGLAPEDRKSQGLLLDWSLSKNVTLADLGRFLRGGLISGREERAAASAQLRALNTVPDDADRLARELSGGNQQKVVLSRWLLHECRVLMLDEPTRGVDVGSRTEIYKLIAELAGRGLGVAHGLERDRGAARPRHADPGHARWRAGRRARRRRAPPSSSCSTTRSHRSRRSTA